MALGVTAVERDGAVGGVVVRGLFYDTVRVGGLVVMRTQIKARVEGENDRAVYFGFLDPLVIRALQQGGGLAVLDEGGGQVEAGIGEGAIIAHGHVAVGIVLKAGVPSATDR